jgi:predicted metal-dependent TIM-barrel fold hydrolase
MTTIIKLVLALALLTAAFQGARATMSNYQFEDAVEQALLFAPNSTDAEVVQQVLTLAQEYGLPVEAENIAISERASDRTVDITYTANVEFIPGIVTQPVKFTPSASVRMLTQQRR